MATWSSRGLRGSGLEELVNFSNETYREKGLALVQKIPTPITPMEFDKETRHITLAYFDQKSTVDYIGVVQGIPICFDAKESMTETVPLQNFHEHQIEFMAQFEKQGGIAFILLGFPHRNEAYYLPYRHLLPFWERAQSGGRKSFTFSELDLSYRIPSAQGAPLHYLETLQKDLNERDGLTDV